MASDLSVPDSAKAVLDFWFGARRHAARDVWFRKDRAFDETIRERFADHVAAALATAIDAMERGFDRQLDHFERWFLYMPFEHSEDRAMQERSLALFGALASDIGDPDALEWAEKHAAIIRRFGRYPHRNAILGRASTPEEIAFLSEPGSSF